MYELIRLRFYQFLEFRKAGKVFASLKQEIFGSEEVVPVKKSLSVLKTMPCHPESSHFDFDVFSFGSTLSDLTFVLKSREARAKIYLKKGYQGLVLLRDKEVVGEVWLTPGSSEKPNNVHPMAELLGLTIGPHEAYMFDMFVSSSERGKSITTYFLNRSLEEMKENGYENVYGFFAADNTPALWIHRILGYEELLHCCINRRFFKASAKTLDAHPSDNSSVAQNRSDAHGLLSKMNSDTIGR
jgi:GNAT superfamily N-acetyltransferase